MYKHILLSLFISLASLQFGYTQCTPVDCAASLPAYGGLCDEFLAQGVVNVAYSDSESFILTDNCFDAGLFDPNLAGTNIKINNIDNITFGNLPNGMMAMPNQTSYAPPAGSYVAGCASFTGTPTEAGVFEASIDFLADVAVCPFNVPIADNAAGFPIEITILPDASFSGLNSTYCSSDAAVTLTPTGTIGGTFSGPGISGNMFDPAMAGGGTHTITYTVSAQEGTAFAAATNSMDMTVTVNTASVFYADTDMDGFGDPNNTTMACSAPAGFVTDNTDCDDTNPGINPNALDIPNNGIDEDCMNGDETMLVDNDNDSFDNSVDCNDNNPNIFPGAPELCNGKDDDCDGEIDEGFTMFTYYYDMDMDGHGTPDSTIMDCDTNPPLGYSSLDDDCDDDNPSVYPNAPELCDGLDNDCNGVPDDVAEPFFYYADLDNDGYTDNNNILDTCSAVPPMGYVSAPTQLSDCDDNNPNINPGMQEECDGIDNNCDGNADEGLTIFTYYIDMDNDGFGSNQDSIMTCETETPMGYADNKEDCDDTNEDIHPDAMEVCDGIDNNCDGNADEGLTIFTYYIDMDNDGFGSNQDSIMTCETETPMGYADNMEDCDDTNEDIHPDAMEVCDGVDNNCDGNVDEGLTVFTYYIDMDNDGFGSNQDSIMTCETETPMGYADNKEDCDDTNEDIYPGATDIPDNGVDEDCNGEDTVPVNDLLTNLGIAVSPNPTNGIIIFELDGNLDVTIELFSTLGQRHLQLHHTIQQGSSIMLPELTNGMYFLKISNEKGSYGIERIIVKN